ncbi:MAG: hypothetical protein M3347_14745 [Armatimonadota bacterium]|nr:hypothetical protein [Armatimonadota bacterium]
MAFNARNMRGLTEVLREFGFTIDEPAEALLSEGDFIGIGMAPLRIEILTSSSGVRFDECCGAHRRSR